MKSLNSTVKTLQTYLIILGLALVSFSCSKDDEKKVDCSEAETTISGLYEDWIAAYIAEDCAEMQDLRSDIIAAVNKYKSCDFIQDELDSEGITFDELLDELNAEFDDAEAVAGC